MQRTITTWTFVDFPCFFSAEVPTAPQKSSQPQDDQGKLTIPKRMLAGACGGVSEAILAVTPIETLKTRVTDDMRRGTGNYTGSFDAVMKILKSEGPAGLYMGFWARR